MNGNQQKMIDSIKKYSNVKGVSITLTIKRVLDDVTQYEVAFERSDTKNSKYKLFAISLLVNIVAVFFLDISLHVLLVIFSTFAFLTFLWITHSVQSESVLIVPKECIQSSVKYVCGQDHKIIPWDNIDDVIINEVIQFQYVMYYLTVITKEENDTMKVIPLFSYTKPRLNLLENVYKDIQKTLRKNIQEQSGGGDT